MAARTDVIGGSHQPARMSLTTRSMKLPSKREMANEMSVQVMGATTTSATMTAATIDAGESPLTSNISRKIKIASVDSSA